MIELSDIVNYAAVDRLHYSTVMRTAKHVWRDQYVLTRPREYENKFVILF